MSDQEHSRRAAASSEEPGSELVAAAGMDEPDGSVVAPVANDSDDVLAMAQVIDEFFAKAKQEKAAPYGPESSDVLDFLNKVDKFTGVDFVRAYRSGKVYPEERLRELILRFTDVRLQQWYIEFDAMMANEHYFSPIHDSSGLADSPNLKIVLMATTQSIIGRSRIAWEKLMRAVYHLETGKDLQPTASRSYKNKFFDWVSTQPKWLFLEPYKSVVDQHDNRFRTGEFHKGSVLRRVVLGDEIPDLNDVIGLSNYVGYSTWANILDIVGGKWPSHFTDLHWQSPSRPDIDSRYLPPTDGLA